MVEVRVIRCRHGRYRHTEPVTSSKTKFSHKNALSLSYLVVVVNFVFCLVVSVDVQISFQRPQILVAIAASCDHFKTDVAKGVLWRDKFDKLQIQIVICNFIQSRKSWDLFPCPCLPKVIFGNINKWRHESKGAGGWFFCDKYYCVTSFMNGP